jgi:hypothetical protein
MVFIPENSTTNEAQVPLAVVVHEEFVVDETTLYEEAKLYPLKGAAPTAPALDHSARTIYFRRRLWGLVEPALGEKPHFCEERKNGPPANQPFLIDGSTTHFILVKLVK